MGYFPNGTSFLVFEEKFCAHCRHQDPDGGGCPVLEAHIRFNYDDCNNPDSILHILIPRDEQGHNKACAMFIPEDPKRCRETFDMFAGGHHA